MFLREVCHYSLPRKGTKAKTVRQSRDLLGVRLIPARGRKPTWNLRFLQQRTLQLIPVRGRKRCQKFHFKSYLADYNLSPQGDGNSLFCDTTHWSPHYNLSPQGDNKAPPSLAFCQQRRCFVLSLFYLQVTGQVSCLRGWSL